MFSIRFISSARARFVATAATVFALVALGGVIATPAYADAASLRIIDASTGTPWAYGNFVLTYTGGGDTGISTDGSGYYTSFIGDGDYYISSSGIDTTVPSDVFNIHIGQTYYDVYVDTYKVSGTIPTDADEGLTAVSVQYYNGTSWGPVGTTLDPGTVASSDGSFLMRAPQGPGSYRLVFEPDSSTQYIETIVPFTIDGSVSIVALGPIALNQETGISGTVYAADGVTALSGATVHATLAGSDVATGASDGAGAYSIALPSSDADYDVWAEAPLYDDSIAQTVSINAIDGYVHSGVDFSLDPTLVTLTGSVLNSSGFGSEIRAELYSGGTASPVLLTDTALVSGDYSFADVPATGTYFIKFLPSGVDPYLPTLLGNGGTTAWAKDDAADSDFSVASSFTVDPDLPATLVHDATISGAAIFRGNLTSSGNPIDGCVTLIEQATITSICVVPESDGSYFFAVPAGDSYKVYAADDLGEYVPQWYDGADDETNATVVGPVTAGQFTDIDFSLARSPATLYAWAHDVTDTNPITVHLYLFNNGEWREADVQDTVFDQVVFNTNLYSGVADGLFAGDYRVRFQDSNGNWIAPTTYSVGLLPEAGPTPVAGTDCFIDIPGVTQGRPNYVDATFDIANDTAGCGPQPFSFGDVMGRVTAGAWGSVDFSGYSAYLTGDDWSDYTYVASDGTFFLPNQPNGDYTFEVLPDEHVAGEHEYGFTQPSLVLTGGDRDLGDLVATRFGNVTGQITNWDDATMSGATATVFRQDGIHWVAGPLDVPISSTGEFEVPGIDVSGEYALLVYFDHTYAPVFIGGGFPEPNSTFTGIAEQDYNLGSVTVTLDEMVTISGTAFFGDQPLLAGVVVAVPVDSSDGPYFFGDVNPDGSYTIDVAPNLDYKVVALDLFFGMYLKQVLMQFADGHNYPFDFDCICGFDPSGPYDFEPVAVGSTDVTDIDFSIVAIDEVQFDLEIESWDEFTGFADLEGVDVHLYKYVVDGWEEVDTATSDPLAWLEGVGDGDYRLRFSSGGDWLAVHDVSGYLSYPYASDVDVSSEFDPAQCYIDFDDVVHGSYTDPEISLIADASTTSCGPETVADHYEAAGTIVTTAFWGYDPIAGQNLTLTNEATNAVFTATTDLNGGYAFDHLSPGTYTLSAPSMPNPYVGMTFAPKTVTGIIVDGDEALDPIELTSYGAAFVEITNWNSAMATATAQLYINHPDVGGDHWTPVGLIDDVDSTGHFLVLGIAEDGEYSVWIDYPAGLVDTYLTDVSAATTITTFTGQAEINKSGLQTLAYTTVSGLASLGVAPVSGATITADSSHGSYTTTTAVNGTYSIAVPASETYSIHGEKAGLVGDGINPVVVGFAAVTIAGLQFHYAGFGVATYSSPSASLPATVHLYRQVTGGWQEVTSAVASTTYLWTNLSGNYRLRFSDGGAWLAASDYIWTNYLNPPENSGGLLSPNPDVCYIDFSPVSAGGAYLAQVLLVTPPTDVICAAEPAVAAPPVTPGAVGSGRPHHAAATTADVVTEEAAEPTATPTPEPSESATDEPDAPVVDKPGTTSSPDILWVFWLSGVIAVLLLVGGAVYFVRRRP